MKRALNAGLWIAQGIIALSFIGAGAMKLSMPIPQLAAIWPWTGELSSSAVRLLGLIDMAGGIGVLLPALTRILPGLTVWAAAGCIALQICAMIFHAARGEMAALPVNVVFLLLSVLICWGRWKAIPIRAWRKDGCKLGAPR